MRKDAGSLDFSVLQVTESWKGPGNKASLRHKEAVQSPYFATYMQPSKIRYTFFGKTCFSQDLSNNGAQCIYTVPCMNNR